MLKLVVRGVDRGFTPEVIAKAIQGNLSGEFAAVKNKNSWKEKAVQTERFGVKLKSGKRWRALAPLPGDCIQFQNNVISNSLQSTWYSLLVTHVY